MKEEINVLIKEDEIVARVKELAEQINRDYEGKTLHLICILKGSVFFVLAIKINHLLCRCVPKQL